MDPFIYETAPSRVVFGFGTQNQVRAEIERLGLKRVLVLSTPEQAGMAQRIADQLTPYCVGTFPRATMHSPVAVTERAITLVQIQRADGVVSIGGGSTIGLGKAIALRTDLPQVVLPTTYAGSEMTPILGETKEGHKTTQRTLKVLPEVVIYDVELTFTLPPAVAVASGMNAIAHAVEALYAKDGNPVATLMASDGIAALVRALPRILACPEDGDARADALYGAWLCGICLGTVGMALHHKLCHTLGGLFNLPHAETHTIMLPHAVAYNAPVAKTAVQTLERVLGPDPARALYDLAGRLGAKRSLKDIGMPLDGIEKASELALANPYWNPRPLEHAAIRNLIARAYDGFPP
jgi:maleylacetate reductase